MKQPCRRRRAGGLMDLMQRKFKVFVAFLPAWGAPLQDAQLAWIVQN
jgi:hypothetical protein